MRVLALLAFVAIPALALAGEQTVETRVVTEIERKSFHTYYQQRFPDAHDAQPVYSVTRASGTSNWTIAAVTDSVPRRGLKPLCRMNRIHFRYDPQAPQDQRWVAADQRTEFVWLDRSGACRAPARAVVLAQRMPDTDVISLLTHQATLLQRARLLLAGNSSCASQRSYDFKLTGLDVGSPGSEAEQMPGLIFQSDRNTTARVWVRKSGLDLNAWNVSCP